MNFYLIIALLTIFSQPFLCRSSEEQQMVLAPRQLRSTSKVEQYSSTQCLGELRLFINKELSKSLKLHEQAAAVAILLQKPEHPAHKSLPLQPTEEKQEYSSQTRISQLPLAESKAQSPKGKKAHKKASSVNNMNNMHSKTTPKSPVEDKEIPISKQRLKARESLFKDYGVTTKENLSIALSHVCFAIYAESQKNDSLSGPYFDTAKHVLYGPVNYPGWSFIFFPCTGDYTLDKISFCNLPNSDKVKKFHCQLSNCTYFEEEIKIIDYEELSNCSESDED